MMSSTARLGAFILAALMGFAVMAFWIGNKQFMFSRTYHISAPFDNVVGLDEGAPVRTGGVRVGSVKHIRLPHQPGDKITVEIELENSTREVIKKDSIASIETEGLLGSKYLAVSFGSADGEQVQNGDMIPSRPPVDYADVARKASDMLDAAREAVDSSKIAISNVNEATDDLMSITGKIDSGKGTIGALINDRAMYHNLNSTIAQAQAGVTSFQEDMEALKHNFFLRGFFKKRGYYDSSELNKNAVAKLPKGAPLKQFVLDGKELFDKPDTAKLRKEKMLNEVGAYLESNPSGTVVIAAQTSKQGATEENLKLTQARAMVVRQYLAQKFKLNDSRIKTLGLGERDEAAGPGGRVAIIVYPGAQDNRTVQVKNK
jgi:phospholipid/cholesterol/gamma-HCH transport system substrate-binding protein